MAYEQAIRTGLFMATLGESPSVSVRDLSSTATPPPEGAKATSLSAHNRKENDRYQQLLRKAPAATNNKRSSLSSSVLMRDVSAKAQATLQAKWYKLSHKKFMTPIFKNWQRMRMILSFNPHQMRQFILGVAVTMHLFTHYSKRGGQVHSDLKRVFFLVFVPFMVPSFVVLGLPLLMFLAPLLLVTTAFAGLNRQAALIQSQNHHHHRRRQDQDNDAKQSLNRFSFRSSRLQKTISNPSNIKDKDNNIKDNNIKDNNNREPRSTIKDKENNPPTRRPLSSSLQSSSTSSSSSRRQRASMSSLRRNKSSGTSTSDSAIPPALSSSDVSVTHRSLSLESNQSSIMSNNSIINNDMNHSYTYNNNKIMFKEQAPPSSGKSKSIDKPRRASFRPSLLLRRESSARPHEDNGDEMEHVLVDKGSKTTLLGRFLPRGSNSSGRDGKASNRQLAATSSKHTPIRSKPRSVSFAGVMP